MITSTRAAFVRHSQGGRPAGTKTLSGPIELWSVRRDTFVRPVLLSFEARCINLAAENRHFLQFRPMTVVAVGRAGGLAAAFKYQNAATSLRHRQLSSLALSADLTAS